MEINECPRLPLEGALNRVETLLNTTSRSLSTVVRISCREGFTLQYGMDTTACSLFDKPEWFPNPGQCYAINDVQAEGTDQVGLIGVVIGCSIAGLIILAVLIALLLKTTVCDESKQNDGMSDGFGSEIEDPMGRWTDPLDQVGMPSLDFNTVTSSKLDGKLTLKEKNRLENEKKSSTRSRDLDRQLSAESEQRHLY
ncbi:unnamed protein product [Owenia fusiformis]|uniref:Uncharacterized protein n=1 Tax=Owenia fusiformis TaxID=6347 RepID=A0A8J1UKB4_OWEFU|nr:unnamed protein product [Owenia fusiformis]